MVSDEIFKKAIVALGEQIGSNVGNLLVIATMQTKALLILADAVRNDPNVEPKTKEQAQAAIKTIDIMIESLEKMAGQDAQSAIKKMLSDSDER